MKLSFDLSKISLIISVICLLLSMRALHNSNKKIYTIGINRLTENFSQQLDNAGLSQKQRAEYMLNFADSLEKNLKSMDKHDMIIFMEESVVSGGQDITEKVAASMREALKK